MSQALVLARTPLTGALPVQSSIILPQGGPMTALLITNIVDDSGSIRDYGNTKAIQRGFNGSLDAFIADTEPRQVVMSTALINRGWLHQGRTPSVELRLDDRNYRPGGGTPLFPVTLSVLNFVGQAAEYLVQRGFTVFSQTCVITDGADTSRLPPSIVKPFVDKLLASGNHVVGGVAVRDGRTDFHRVFTEMGIAEQWIEVLEREDGDIEEGLSRTMGTASRTSTINVDAWTAGTRTGFREDPEST